MTKKGQVIGDGGNAWAVPLLRRMAQRKKQQSQRRRRRGRADIPVFRTLPYAGRAAPDGKTTRKLPRGPAVRNRSQALLQVEVLVEALEEVDAFDPLRPGNRPPPALWLDHPTYSRDVKCLLGELRDLRDVLREGDKPGPTANATVKKTIGLLTSTTVKFIDGYADALGKGAAALTIGAAGALLFHLGASKDILGSLWDHLRLGR